MLSNSCMRPVDTDRDGIFICGLAHSPQSLSASLSQASAAAGKAGFQQDIGRRLALYPLARFLLNPPQGRIRVGRPGVPRGSGGESGLGLRIRSFE